MNTTGMNSEATDGSLALVTFRVRAEKLGYGETVYLYPDDTPGKVIPLHTSPTMYPWYIARTPVILKVNASSEDVVYGYRYGVFRTGVFHRWENREDTVSDLSTDDCINTLPASTPVSQADIHHRLPLRLLSEGELYMVSDVLGQISSSPDIEHIHTQHKNTMAEVSSLNSTRDTTISSGKSSSLNLGLHAGNNVKDDRSKKKVAFAPAPTRSRTHSNEIPTPLKKSPVYLDSTDGLIVVSAFLPVHLNRTETGEWTADWDYESLLSMQTHLRVTRVGIVKWRGWHGNKGASGSPEGGVPEGERSKVEQCLKALNCIPVWMEPSLFGQMYNGFCKGVLWPVLHHLTSVYSAQRDANTEVDVDKHTRNNNESRPTSSQTLDVKDMSLLDMETLSSVSSQFDQYSMDDVEMGTIHGDGGKEASLWAAYTAVNRKFADAVVQCFNEGDLIWIHGFHLMILPSFLTRRIPMAKVGLFLHTPFPSSEIFRTLWCREDLLRGMLNADQVGFHLFEYARHFLTCCRRLLGLRYGMIPDENGGHNLAIETNGRHVGVTSIHAGIEPPIMNQVLMHPSTMEKAEHIRNQFKGKIIFCAIDRLESLKGIPLKLLGLERFLHRCPEWVGKIVFIQFGISAYERGHDYIRTRTEVLSMVASINKIWPGTVQFQERAEAEMRLPQRMALMRASDVMVFTPIRDGLNLIPLEYTMAHLDYLSEQGRRDGRLRGLCVLSEFSSCARVMRGALHVNPWKIAEIADSFYQALTMTEDERIRRLTTASEFVTRVTTQRWALAVLLDLKAIHKSANVGKYSGAGLGLGYRLVGMETGFNSLETSTVAKSYKDSLSRLILLDYGGTILSNDNLDNLSRFQLVTKARKYGVPTPRMLATLQELCHDKRNMVFIVSGKERASLLDTLNDISNLGLVAEHGMFISWPGNTSGGKRVWETLVSDQDSSWRQITISIMEVYKSRTHGSYIEETEMKVLWQYRDADPEFGYLQAKELEDHLSNVLRNYSVDILHGGIEEGGYVEVRPKGVNKGVAAIHILKHIRTFSTWQKIDFGLILGDDHCDEPMLSVMRQIGRRKIDARRAHQGDSPLPSMPASVTQVDVSLCDEFTSSNLEMFTCTVGKKPSAAANYLHDVDEVEEFLDSLVKMSGRDKKFFSSIDLRGLSLTPTSPKLEMKAKVTIDNKRATFPGVNVVLRSSSMGNIHHHFSNTVKSSEQKVGFLGGVMEDDGVVEEEEEEEDGVFF